MTWRQLSSTFCIVTLLAAVGCTPPSSVEISPSLEDSQTPGANELADDTSSSETILADGGRQDSAANSTGAQPESVSDSPGDIHGTVAYSALTLTNPFFVVIADSLKKAGAEHGFQVTVDDVEWVPVKQTTEETGHKTFVIVMLLPDLQ